VQLEKLAEHKEEIANTQ
jgi:ABC-type Fe3+-citrate transport system substrate-binding protein